MSRQQWLWCRLPVNNDFWYSAKLRCAELQKAVLCCAVLCCAVLCCAVLQFELQAIESAAFHCYRQQYQHPLAIFKTRH